MGTITLPRVGSGMSVDDLADIVARLIKEVEFLANGNIDSSNTREIGGFQIGPDSIKSRNGVVGLSSAKTDVDDIRIWAGDSVAASAAYRVYESGKFIATDAEITGKITAQSGQIGGWTIEASQLSGSGTISGGAINGSSITGSSVTGASITGSSISGTDITGSTITGGTLQTGSAGSDRIEISGGKFRGLTSSEAITGLFFDISTIAGTGIADLFLYHNGTKLAEFYDNITGFIFKGSSGSTGLILGGTSAPTFGAGNWTFNSGSSLDLSQCSIVGLSASYSGFTDPGGTDGHTHAFTFSTLVNSTG